jgi:hypothetical protein
MVRICQDDVLLQRLARIDHSKLSWIIRSIPFWLGCVSDNELFTLGDLEVTLFESRFTERRVFLPKGDRVGVIVVDLDLDGERSRSDEVEGDTSVLSGFADVAVSLPAASICLGDRADEGLGVSFLLGRGPFTVMVARLGDSSWADPVGLMDSWETVLLLKQIDVGVFAARDCSNDDT